MWKLDSFLIATIIKGGMVAKEVNKCFWKYHFQSIFLLLPSHCHFSEVQIESEKEVEIAFLRIILFQTFCISIAKTFKSLSKQNELGEKERERHTHKDRKTEDSSCKRASAPRQLITAKVQGNKVSLRVQMSEWNSWLLVKSCHLSVPVSSSGKCE